MELGLLDWQMIAEKAEEMEKQAMIGLHMAKINNLEAKHQLRKAQNNVKKSKK